MLNSVRSRLTLFYVMIFGVLLGAFGLFLYALIRKDAHDRFDLSLTMTARTVANLFHQELIENGQEERVATAHALREYQQPSLFLAIFRDDRLLAANRNQNAESPPAGKEFLAQAVARRAPVLTTIAVDGRDEWRLVAYAPGGETAEFVIVAA